MPMTEGDIMAMMKHEAIYVRCAAFLYVRLGFHVDRYWESLSEHLMDDSEFRPFTSRSGESATTTVGEYVEALLGGLEYGETEMKLMLPRIPVAQRKMVSRRLCLYPQFRKRYTANLHELKSFREGLDVEVCSVDGQWREAKLRDNTSHRTLRCTTVAVAYADGSTPEHVSIGRVIVPSRSHSPSRSRGGSHSSDLSKSRGISAQDLLERYDEEQKGNALARGRDYCKIVVEDISVGGPRGIIGAKRGRPMRRDEPDDDDDDLYDESRSMRRRQEQMDNRAQRAAIESKYCARVQTQSSTPAGDHLRLG